MLALVTEPVAPAERNLPRLTSLRAFAAFGVLVFHLQFWTGWSVTEVLAWMDLPVWHSSLYCQGSC
jgi:peptidoglycan/LPS O-acetylase OafA/YrhL